MNGITLRYSHVRKIDLRDRLHLFNDERDAELFMAPAGIDHHRLLATLALQFQFARFVELGTHAGRSAAALTVNPTNTVLTYDISAEQFRLRPPPNLIRRVGDIFELGQQRELLRAALIFLDAAHDGDFERRVFSYLKRNDYAGLLICDDIYWSDAMADFWERIDVLKYDVTEVGHGPGDGPRGNVSGTGIVDFSGALTIIRD
jgi:predicted O-methyltransferase YrrM